MMVTCMLIASFRSHHLPQALSFSVLRLWHTCADSHPNKGFEKGHISDLNIFAKNILLKLNFKDEGHVDANFLIYILTIYREFLRFQFFSRLIRMHTLTLTVVQNAPISL